MSTTSRIASLSAAALGMLVGAVGSLASDLIADQPGDPLRPSPGSPRGIATSAQGGLGVIGRKSVLGTGAILIVDPATAPCGPVIGFDDVTAAPPPGTSHDGVLESGFTDFAERFAGQSVSAAGDFDVLSGDASNPLRLAVGESGRNLGVMSYLGDAILFPLGPVGYPSFTAVGEGSFAVLFDADQSRLSFDVLGGDGGSARIDFFRRDGSRIDALTLASLTDRRYAFLRAGEVRDIAGFSVWNDDIAGIGVDRICHDVAGVVGHAPVCDAGGPYSGDAGEIVSFDGSGSSDPEGGALAYEWRFGDGATGAGVLSSHVYDTPGLYAVRLCVTDLDGARSCCESRVEILPGRNGTPDCAAATAEPNVLWPPNHKMVPIRIVGITDSDADSVSITITGVTSSEPQGGRGSGQRSPDVTIDADGRLWLRSERAGRGSGRTYVVSFTARDGRGGECSGHIEVCAPKSRAADCGASAVATSEVSGAPVASHRLELRHAGASGTSVAIEYALPRAGHALLAVYDLAGRVRAVLERGSLAAGSWRAVWNTAGVAPGLYFCALRSEGETRVLRLVVR